LRRCGFESVAAVISIAAVFWLTRCVLQRFDYDWKGHFVGLTNAHIDEVHIWLGLLRGFLGPFDLLKLLDGGGFAVLIAADTLSKEFLDV
jgi:hypothetical protein